MDSNEFRTKIKSLGHSENKSELTSGGNINPDFLNILSQVLDDWKISNPNCKLMFTSGNDNFHKNRKSLHTSGQAVDVTLSNSCKSDFLNLLNSYRTKYNGFSYIDEYVHPSQGSTGGHIHISYSSGSPENNDLLSNSPEGDSIEGTIGKAVDTYLNKFLGLTNEHKIKRISENSQKINKLIN